MPIYEYKCSICGKEFEELVSNGENKIPCPECGSRNCEKMFSVFGFSTGNGFVSSAGKCDCSGCAPSPGKCRGCK